jgi:hypothetical protein
MAEFSLNALDPDRDRLSKQWRRRTIRALIFARVMTGLAVGLFIAGVAVYFANFNFGSGGDTRGAVILVAAACLGVIALIGDLYGIFAASVIWRSAGSGWWLAIALLLPVLEIVAFALVQRAL